MKSENLIYRERTTEMLLKVLGMPVKDQLLFFGCENETHLQFIISKVNEKLKNKVSNFLVFDLILINTNEVIGSCGFHNWESFHQKAELGYMLYEKYRNKGYMTEAIENVIRFGFEKLKLNRIEAQISTTNLPSIKVVEKNNFKKEGCLFSNYKVDDIFHDSLVFALLAKDYNLIRTNLF